MEEIFYACAWTSDMKNLEPLISMGGLKGIIRTIAPYTGRSKPVLVGHGSSINDLRYHPSRETILLSASKDHTLRLWNIDTSVCIAIFGGVEGHRDEVLSADFNMYGTLIMSCSIDHYLKMWNLKNPKLVKAIEASETFKSTNRWTIFNIH